jgi:hypothetical protein
MINDKDRDFIDHEVRLQVMKGLNDERFLGLNRKLNIIMTGCGAIFAAVLIPIFLHAMKLV